VDLLNHSQENGPVCQVETVLEIMFVYRAYLVVTVHKILAADTWSKGAKICPKLEQPVQIRATAHACDGSEPSAGAVFSGAF
jgi:hypothetical protein